MNANQNPQGYPVQEEIDGWLTIRDLTGLNPVPPTPVGGVTFYPSGGSGYTMDSSGNSYSMVDANPVGANTSGALAETMARALASGQTALTSGTLEISEVFLVAGQSIGHLGFAVGTTAAVTPTHWWGALLNSAYLQVAHTADQGSAAIPASTWQALALVTPYKVPATGRYYVALCMVAATMPTLCGSAAAPAAAMVTGTGAPTPLIGGSSTTGLTTPGTDGTTTYLAPTAAAAVPYGYVTT